MAKRKKEKQHARQSFSRAPGAALSIPEHAKRLILGVFMFAVALIFTFSFFQKAGNAGDALFSFFSYLLGKAIFLAPFFFTITGLVLFGMKQWSVKAVLFALSLLLVGVGGILGVGARAASSNIQEVAGIVGFLVSWPVFEAFGFWVSEIVFVCIAAASGIIFWQLLDHETQQPLLPEATPEKIKKVFEPKFQVQEVEPEPTIRNGNTAEPKAEKGKESDKTGKPFETLPLVEGYTFPPTDLLEAEKGAPAAGDIKLTSAVIKKTLANFDIPVEISEVNIGPTVTQYAFKPAEGIKLSRIVALSNDLALALAAHPIRIEAPIPGRSLVGIEIPNKVRATVRLRNLIEHAQFQGSPAPLLLSLGKDVSGSPMFTDLARMPHMLVAGATGSGKTIALNNIILSLIYRNSPSQLRFILVDPKRVEFPVYNELPHLLTPVILDIQRTINALKWLIKEMERRFQVLAQVKTRDIGSYHAYAAAASEKEKEELETMPYIVVVIDELADLMAARGKEMEGMIVRLAQMARAVGIHLVLATQRPSVEVITGLIKANITARIAFQVASQVDSRTILDSSGAEKLLGQGDLLFVSSEFSRPKRIQGAYVSDKDIKKVAQWITKESKDFVREEIAEDELAQSAAQGLEIADTADGDDDVLYEEAKRVVIESKKASASLLQRRLKVGYARAARLLDILEDKGVIGPGEGAKPREVYVRGKEDDPAGWFSP